MSEVECAGSVDTSNTRLPAWLAASAIADAHVVLPTPPLPPKNRTRFSSRRCSEFIAGSAARQRAQGRLAHPHAAMPEMELLEQIGIDVQQIERGRIREPDDLHVAKQQEEIVQLGRLQTQLSLVLTVSGAVQEIADVVANGH